MRSALWGLGVAAIAYAVDGAPVSALLAGGAAAAAAAALTLRLEGDGDARREVARVRELLAAGAGAALFTWAPRGRLWFSPQWTELFDLPSGELGDAEAWFERVHPEDLGALVHALDTLRSGEQSELQQQYRLRRGGEWRAFDLHVRAVEGPGGRVLAGAAQDVTVRHARQERLQHSAFHDPLTGLANRALFLDRLQHSVARARRNPLHRFAVVFIDVDNFKVINDSLGHHAGDDVLGIVARRLVATARPGDTVARIGGDEFTVLLDPVESVEDAERVADRLRAAVHGDIVVRGHTAPLSTSVGVAFSNPDYADPLDLLRDADTAMYHAKRSGPGRQARFDRAMHATAMRRLEVESELRRALEESSLTVVYQPIVGLRDGRVEGFEALARLVTPGGATIGPVEFIPLAEAQGLIDRVLEQVLDDVAGRLHAWSERHPGIYVSVNVSARSVQPTLVERVVSRMERHALTPARLKLELTESVMVGTSEVAGEALAALGRLGIGLYIDDFGTGYSSLAYLHQFPAERIKLDRVFVSTLGGERVPEIVETVVALSKRIGAAVIAEGIENAAQLAVLRRIGVAAGQGFHFAPAVSGEAAGRLLDEGRTWPVD